MQEWKEAFILEVQKQTGEQLKRSSYGHVLLESMPSAKELEEFYQEKYFNDPVSTAKKGMDTGEYASDAEKFHFERQYDETINILTDNNIDQNSFILDAGCGHGEFLRYLSMKGYKNLFGTEFDPNLSVPGANIFNGDFLNFETDIKFHFISMHNVMEHVIDPKLFLAKAYSLLAPGGIIKIQVPNDFSITQYKVVKDKEDKNFHFFCPPQHLHYFDFNSLRDLLESFNFIPFYSTTQFPMEFFLLMGLDYTKDKSLGSQCHKYRVNFEHKMGAEFLSSFYQKLAELDMGREVIIYAKKN